MHSNRFIRDSNRSDIFFGSANRTNDKRNDEKQFRAYSEPVYPAVARAVRMVKKIGPFKRFSAHFVPFLRANTRRVKELIKNYRAGWLPFGESKQTAGKWI